MFLIIKKNMYNQFNTELNLRLNSIIILLPLSLQCSIFPKILNSIYILDTKKMFNTFRMRTFFLSTFFLYASNFIFSFDAKPLKLSPEPDWFDTFFDDANHYPQQSSEETISTPLEDIFELPIPISYAPIELPTSRLCLPRAILTHVIDNSAPAIPIQHYKCNQCTKYTTTCKKYLQAHIKRMHSPFATHKQRLARERIIYLSKKSLEENDKIDILN